MAERSGAEGTLESPHVDLNDPLGGGQALRVATGKPCRNLLPFERHANMRRNEAVTNTLPRHAIHPGPDAEGERMQVREPGYPGAFNAIRTGAGLRLASRSLPSPADNALAFTAPEAEPHDAGDLPDQIPGPVSRASLRMAH